MTDPPDDIVVRLLEASEAGVFPSALHPGEILRYQALRDGAEVSAADVSVAFDHGRELLDYVVADLP